MGIRNDAAEVMEHLCNHEAHGYSQPNRQGIGTGGGVGETITLSSGRQVGISYGDRDCSSAVIECFSALGVDCGGATYTGDMLACMVGSGNFRQVDASAWRDPARGDILLNQGKHTALALGNGLLGEFLRSENRSVHGKVGDQDGGESVIRAVYDDDWDVVLRYAGPDADGGETAGYDGEEGAGFGGSYRVACDELNVRYAPGLSGAVSGVLAEGDTVVLDDWSCEADGGVWGRYTGYSGATLYVCVRFDGVTLAEKGYAYSLPAGEYTFRYGMNVRSAPSTDAEVVASYSAGQSVTIDATETRDGYVWGSYTGASSGLTRYVALATADGSEKYVY